MYLTLINRTGGPYNRDCESEDTYLYQTNDEQFLNSLQWSYATKLGVLLY